MASRCQELRETSGTTYDGRFVRNLLSFITQQTIVTGMWLLEELQSKVTKANATSDCAITPAISDMSGVEIISPHKTPARVPCTINGIGELQTSWIGQKGVSNAVQCFNEGN